MTARTSTYMNFNGQTGEAFAFYREVFRSEYVGQTMTMGELPGIGSTLSADDQAKIMHIELPILGGHVLMGTDTLASMGHTTTFGTNMSLNLEPETRADADRLFAALSEGGTVGMAMHDAFWGSYFGTLTDRFGVRWMINCR